MKILPCPTKYSFFTDFEDPCISRYFFRLQGINQ